MTIYSSRRSWLFSNMKKSDGRQGTTASVVCVRACLLCFASVSRHPPSRHFSCHAPFVVEPAASRRSVPRASLSVPAPRMLHRSPVRLDRSKEQKYKNPIRVEEEAFPPQALKNFVERNADPNKTRVNQGFPGGEFSGSHTSGSNRTCRMRHRAKLDKIST